MEKLYLQLSRLVWTTEILVLLSLGAQSILLLVSKETTEIFKIGHCTFVSNYNPKNPNPSHKPWFSKNFENPTPEIREEFLDITESISQNFFPSLYN